MTSASDGKLVQVWATADVALLAVVKSMLESEDIPFLVQGEEALGLFPVGPGLFGGLAGKMIAARLLVPEERADEARALIEDGASAGADAEDR